MPDMQNNREGPQARETSKFLDGQSYGERLAKNAFRMPATSGSKKDSNRAITPAVEAVRVQLGSPGQAAAPPSHSTLTWAEPPQTKKKKYLASMRAGLLWSCPTLCSSIDCGLPGFSVSGFLQARIQERSSQYWLPCPSRALYFLLP